MGGKFSVCAERGKTNSVILSYRLFARGHSTASTAIWGSIFHEIEFDQDLGNVRLESSKM
jgi:hypothetical protein